MSRAVPKIALYAHDGSGFGPTWVACTRLLTSLLLTVNVISGEALNSGYGMEGGTLPENGSYRERREQTLTQLRKRIKGTVVAYDVGIETADGTCRRTIIFHLKRTKATATQYIVLRRDGSCMNPIPEKVLLDGRQRSLSVIYSAKCDQPIKELLYFEQLNEDGTLAREPRLESVPGVDLKRIPTTHKLPCYLLHAGLP